MKKTLSLLGLLSVLAFSAQASQAFEWGYLNPANWFNSACRCQKQQCNCGKCDKCKKVRPCQPRCQEAIPCPAAPPAPCDACDTLQNQMQHRNSIR